MELINLHWLLLTILCVVLNFTGFFPLPDTQHRTIQPKNSTVDAKFDRAVLVVIDALRLDFVTPQLMPRLFGDQKRDGCLVKLKVETPTVTLPRIKALVMGSVPTFVDLLLNFGNAGAIHDSLLHHAASQQKRSVFYGDDTWLRIYPGDFFLRREGTNSFFVHDFKEVDDNVTRNMRLELKRHDWDIMILHYLGLDHIGHVHGPRSALIPEKLAEMDALISEIRNAPSTRPGGEKLLLLITGDHGMKDSGGHGGATYSETHVPFVVLGAPCSDDSFNQVDVTANIAVLLGLDIPSTSIGLLKRSLLGSLTMSEYLQALNTNARLLLGKSELSGDDFATAEYLHDLYSQTNQTRYAVNAIEFYDRFSEQISNKLTRSSVDQNVYAIAIAFCVMLCVLVKIANATNKKTVIELGLLWIVPVLAFIFHTETLFLALVAVALLLLLKNIIQTDGGELKSKLRKNISFLIAGSMVYPFVLISSSLVEEEHMFWYLFCSTFAVLNLLATKSLRSFLPWLCLTTVLRFLKTINQVGDHWAHLPDFKDWLLSEGNQVYFHAFFIFGLILTSIALHSLTRKRRAVNVAVDLTILSLIYVFKTAANRNASLGKVLWAAIFSKLLLCKFGNFGVESVWILAVTLLIKPYNVVMVPACVFASGHFQKSCKTTGHHLILAHFWMGTVLFFAQGHCNSISSVDVTAGYVGLSSYHPFLVFCQVLCHTYAFPILSHFLLLRSSKLDKNEFLVAFMTFRIYVILVVIAVTFGQRQHLFIWSVFAPKLFVESINLTFQFLVIFAYFFCSHYVNVLSNKLL